MTDAVRDYLSSRGCAEHVVRDGLEGLVRGWEYMVNSVASGRQQGMDEYLSAMDGRDILDKALAIAPPDERAQWTERVRAADDKIRPFLTPIDECLQGQANEVKYGHSRDRDWWYYNRPIAGLI